MAAAARRVALRLAPGISVRTIRPSTFRCASLRPASRPRQSVNPRRAFGSSNPRWFPEDRVIDDDDESEDREENDEDDEDKGKGKGMDKSIIDIDDDGVFDKELEEPEDEELTPDERFKFQQDLDAAMKEAGITDEAELDSMLQQLNSEEGMFDREKMEPEQAEELLQMIDRESLQWKDENRDEGDPDDVEDDFNYEEEFGAMGEPKEEQMEDEHWENDDITSKGHGELDQMREIREYARWAAWELPLLSKFAKPFKLPEATQPLRFRYTSYLGDAHASAKKVVVQFHLKDLPDLSDQQRNKLIHLLGPRYNPDKEVAKMSCESFETPAQNKRYLSDTIDSLLQEAKNGEDTFGDLPFDFRHHKDKSKPRFPKSWLVTPERKKQIDEGWTKMQQIEDQRRAEGKLTSGQSRINEALLDAPEPEPEPVMARTRGRR